MPLATKARCCASPAPVPSQLITPIRAAGSIAERN